MDINSVVLTGVIHSIGVNPTKGLYPVVEARLTVCVGHTEGEGDLFDEFNIRAFGKKTTGMTYIKEGTSVTIQGKLKEDIRVNADNPNTTRSKTYVNIDNIKVNKE